VPVSHSTIAIRQMSGSWADERKPSGFPLIPLVHVPDESDVKGLHQTNPN
jgi:hypothetical protein